MALTLDGTASILATSGLSASTGTLACANAGNIICVDVLANLSASISSITGGGVTFSQRAVAGSGTSLIYRWTGYSSGIFNAAITVNFSPASTFASVHAYGVSGAPSSSYFDPNGALPDVGNGDPRSVTTSNAIDIILAAFRMGSTPDPTAGNIDGVAATQILGASGSGYLLTQYRNVSATITGGSVTIGTGAGDSNGGIADAIIAAAAAGGFIPIIGRGPGLSLAAGRGLAG